ncbi:MAG: AEC family transporter [Halieaceae bacterium]|jgi:predicted permease|nr:AEC family transporter [Halieaceae bacterium]
MSFVLALVPVIAVVALGHFLAARDVPPPEGWRAIERLCFVLLFPCLIVRVLANAPFENMPWRLALALVAAQLLMAALGHAARLWPGLQGPTVASIIQSNVRWNTFVALSLAGALFGDEGLALTAIAAAAMIPTANVISILGFARYGNAEVRRHPFVELLQNPLVIACILGIAINLSGITVPAVLDAVMEMLASAALALGLLAAGAGIDLQALGRGGMLTLFWSLLRVLLMPALAISAALLLGVDGVGLVVVAIASATPTATNGYILARQLGGDAPFMANLIATQTLFAVVSMPLVMWLAGLS